MMRERGPTRRAALAVRPELVFVVTVMSVFVLAVLYCCGEPIAAAVALLRRVAAD